MAFTLLYFDEVEADVQLAKTWYKERKKGLEIEFAAAIEKVIEHIVNAPEAYAIRYKNLRIAHPKRFPYNIHFYILKPHTVIITAIVHNKRHPGVARKRL